jgi:hypothetical protein
MNVLAYLVNDGPGFPWLQLQLCVYFPAGASLVGVLLLWRSRKLFIPALLVAVAAAAVVVADVSHPLTRDAMLEDFGASYVAAIVIAALIPFCLITWAFFFLRRKVGRS